MRRFLRVVVIVATLTVFALFVGVGLAADAFSDVPTDHRFHNEIMTLAQLGVVDGYPDGTFRPDAFVLRAQAAKILVNVFEKHTSAVDNASNPTFLDVVPAMGVPYPFDFVEEAAEAGYFLGQDGLFMPWQRITRLQLALVLARAGAGVLEPPPSGYVTGFTDVPDYALNDVALLKFNGVLDGTSNTTFSPYNFATRGHVAKMVARLIGEVTPPGTTVTGRVTNTAGAGVVAHIVISNPADHAVIAEGDTDASGNFTITLATHTGGTYVKAVPTDLATYLSNEEYVRIVAGQANVRNITVSAQPPANATFVGTNACQGCHQAKWESFQGTLHARSIQEDLSEFDEQGWPAVGQTRTLEFQVALPGETTATVNPVLSHPDATHYFVQIGPTTYPVAGTYGGPQNENPTWKQRYMTPVPDAVDVNTSTHQDYLILPIQWNTNEEFGDPALAKWVAYKATAWWKVEQSFAAQCAGCHNTGTHYTFDEANRVTHFDYVELNIGCEKCHGAASAHVASPGKAKFIVNPNFMVDLDAQSICGQCHSRGDSVEPEGHEYPWNETLGGEYQIGADLMDYYTWTYEINKTLHPAWYWIAAAGNASYPDGYIAARAHHEQMNDLAQGAMPMLKCGQCHDVHGTDFKRNLVGDPNGSTAATNSCGNPVGCHTHDAIFAADSVHKTQRLLTMGVVNYDCSWCHMNETSQSAQPFVVDPDNTYPDPPEGEYRQGDIANHTFRPIRPSTVDASGTRVPDSCNMIGCHADVSFPVTPAMYDAKAAAVRAQP